MPQTAEIISPMLLEPDESLGWEAIALILEERAASSWETFVERALPYIRETYGRQSNEALVGELFALLKPSIDRIFIEQFRAGPPDGSMSWIDSAPEAVTDLRSAKDAIFADAGFQRLFTRYPEYQIILNTLANEVPMAADRETFKRLSRLLEKKAIALYDKGAPILVCLLDQLIVARPADESEYMDIVEADLRLVWQLPDEEKAQIKDMVRVSWAKIKDLPFEKMGFESPPSVVAGLAIGVAGTQLFETNAGQAFFNQGFYLASNFYKNSDMVQKIAASGYKVAEGMAKRVTTLLYILHELAHIEFDTALNSLDEIMVDLPTVLTFLVMIKDRTIARWGISIENAIPVLLAEYAYYALRRARSAPLDKGYWLSGRAIVEYLTRYGMVAVESDKLLLEWHHGIDITSLMLNIVDDYQALPQNNKPPEDAPAGVVAKFLKGEISPPAQAVLDYLAKIGV